MSRLIQSERDGSIPVAEAAHADIADVVTGPPVLSGKTL